MQVAAGLAHSLAVTSSGQLYAFGNNYSGQLGIAATSGTNNATPPTLVRLPGATGPVVQVSGGLDYSLAVTSTGQLYAFGDNDYGELGSATNNGPFNFGPNPTPMLVSLPGGASVETVARGATAKHSLVVTGSPAVIAVPSTPFTVRHVRVDRRGTVQFDVTVPESGELDVLETNWTPSPSRRAHTVLLRPGPDRYAFARRHLVVASAGMLHVTVLPSARGARQVGHHHRPLRINLWVTYQAADSTPATVAFINLLVTR